MATKVMMEALSPTMEEGRLVKWFKSVGDAIKSGETIAEVETDKAIMELVARGDGVMRSRMLDEGGTSPVGETIAIIAGADEDISALEGAAPGGGGAPKPEASAEAKNDEATPDESTESAESKPAVVESAKSSEPAAETPVQTPTPDAKPAATPAAAAPDAAKDSEHVRSSPLARRLASERGISLEDVSGSGPNGRIIRRDIEKAGAGARAASAQAPSTGSASATAPAATGKSVASAPTAGGSGMVIEGDHKDVALTQMRKTIARRLAESIGPIPTFYLTAEIDMTKVGELREQMSAAGDEWRVSINDIVIKAVAIALVRHPEVNAHWMTDHIRHFASAHVGMAVATDDGLIVPVIRDAQAKGLGEIGREARSLAKRARERKLTPDEFSGGTFSVSNLGMFGIDQFTAIINPPEAAILAVGTTETKPVYENGEFVPRQRMSVTLSCDHRVIDGAVGARFLQTLKLLLERPMMMLY